MYLIHCAPRFTWVFGFIHLATWNERKLIWPDIFKIRCETCYPGGCHVFISSLGVLQCCICVYTTTTTSITTTEPASFYNTSSFSNIKQK